MATYYIDPSSNTNGDGTIENPFNTFVGITWGSNNSYLIKAGTTLKETITPASGNTMVFSSYGAGALDKATIDCENTRADGINLNSRTSCTISNLRFINQNANPTNAALRVTGSKHTIYNCVFEKNRVAIHVNSSFQNRIYDNYIDIGNLATEGEIASYGIRVNGASSVDNYVIRNTLRSSVRTFFISSIQVYNASRCFVGYNDVAVPYADGPGLRSGTTASYLVGNYVHGEHVLDGLIIEGSSGNFVYNNTVIHLGDTPGHFGPAFKMGNEFGAGSPSDNNVIKNNVFVAHINIAFSGNVIGTNNIFSNNCYYRTTETGVSPTIITYNTGSGSTNYTLTAWQALGYDANSLNESPSLYSNGIPKPESPVKDAGTFVGFYLDADKNTRPNPPSIGAFEYHIERPEATVRGVR
jgi:hypothetical protein